MRPPSLPLSFLSSEIFSRCNLKWGGGGYPLLGAAVCRRKRGREERGRRRHRAAPSCLGRLQHQAGDGRRTAAGRDAAAKARRWEGPGRRGTPCLQPSVCVCVCVCPCVRLSPAQLRAGSSLVGTGREGVGLVPDSDLQLSGSRLFPSNSAWIPHTEPKCQFTALSPAPFP